MKGPSLLRSLATVAAAAVVISGAGLAAAQVASAAPIGTVTFNGLTTQTQAFSVTTSGACPTAPTLATNFQIRITSITGNLTTPALITGNTAATTVGSITDGIFTAGASNTLQNFAIANSVPGAAASGLGAGTYQLDVVCRTNTSGASLGEFTGQFTVTSLTSVTPVAPVADKNTTTTLATTPAGSAAFGSSVTLTATVVTTPASASFPTGTVQFKDGGTNVGAPATLNASGVATLATTTLAAGARSLTAVYTAGAGYNDSTSTATAIMVKSATSTALVTAPVGSSTSGSSVTLTATVSNTSEPSGATPNGSVDFKDGATTIGSGTLVAGVATFATSALADGAHSLTAVYVPSATFVASTSPAVSFTVSPVPKDATSTTLSVTPPTGSDFGTSVTLSAVVANTTAAATTPIGGVQFRDGTTVLGTVTLDASGAATFPTTTLAVGARSLTAVYVPNGAFNASTSTTVPFTITGIATTTTLDAAPASPVSFGVSVVLTAGATSASGTPTGSVQFKDGGTVIGTGTLDGSGVASFATSGLSVSSHSLTAVLVPTGGFAASTSTALSFTVDAAVTATTLGAAPAAASTFGDPVALSATVANSSTPGVIPTGSVQFKDGDTVLGSAVLNASGIATLTTAALTVGQRSLTAVYLQGAGFTTSTSAILTFTVGAAATSTSLVTAPVGSATVGAPVTLTAAVSNTTAPSGGKPTGSVQFTDSGAPLGSPVALGASGVATVTTSSLAAGAHSFTAVFTPTGGYTASSSSAVSLNVVILVPAVVTPTKLAGPARVGTVLTCVRGTFTNATTYTYQFLRNGIVVQTSATVATRKMGLSDLNATFSCNVIASNGTYSVPSLSTGIRIRPGAAPVATIKPSIKGTARVGRVLTASLGSWSPKPTAYRLIWKRGATILGRGTTYRTTSRDRGRTVSLFVYAVKTGYLTGVSSVGLRIR